MMGMAMGLALKGLRPMVILERFDFIGNCFDALVNHIDKSAIISRGQWTPGVIVRVVVGNSRKPLFTGATHTQDFTAAFRKILRMPVYRVTTPDEVAAGYEAAIADQKQNRSTMIVELKDNL
jgi:pyruvate/2-oxoglutarate/acetoin dehydrogenase E1 component